MGIRAEQFIPCGQWLPDQPSYQNPGCNVADNVVPVTGTTYAPMPAFATAASTALDGVPLAAFSARDSSGNPGLYAGTTDKLYVAVAATAPNFTNASHTGGYTALTWSFAAFNGKVYAANGVDPLQSVDVAVNANFAPVGGNAPTGKVLAVVQPGFLVVGNINDVTVGIQTQGLRWSALNDASSTGWPLLGTTAAIAVQSDWQAITGDHGNITGIAADLPTAAAAIFFETAIFLMIYTGDQFIFNFTPVAKAMGTSAPDSIVQRNQTVYYLGSDGFYQFDGTASTPISAERVSHFFFDDCDPNYLTKVNGFVDPGSGLIFWTYTSTNSLGGVPNRILVYNTITDRWSRITGFLGYQPFLGRTLGVTLDQIDALGYTLDDLPFSLDDKTLTGGLNVLAGFDQNFKLGYFAGVPMAWEVETTEAQLYPGMRGRISYGRPIVEGDDAFCAVAARNDLNAFNAYSAATPMNADGICPFRSEGRYHRFRISGNAASTVTHIKGVAASSTPGGKR